MTDKDKKPYSDSRWNDLPVWNKIKDPDPNFELSEEQKEGLKSWNEFVEQLKKDAKQS